MKIQNLKISAFKLEEVSLKLIFSLEFASPAPPPLLKSSLLLALLQIMKLKTDQS